jgi:hypothetical protein
MHETEVRIPYSVSHSDNVGLMRHCGPVAHDTCFTVCIGEVGVSPAAPKTLDAGSGRDECVAFAPTTHPDPLGIRNGRSEVLPSLPSGGEDSISINFDCREFVRGRR